jgi:exopolyphosphatase/guanosine-5'-triphosphate,3'-diphosphate pyrophosphatase
MVIARVVDHELHIISRHKQKVQLASGLDDHNILSQASIERGIECLREFGQRLRGFAPDNVRIAATHTLRVARNQTTFLEQARAVMPYAIEIIPGEEEARLIYLGVAHTINAHHSNLIIDIGGGSTELVIGQNFEPQYLSSAQMGCINFTARFFATGKLTKNNFVRANLAAQQKLEGISHHFAKHGWQSALGASGTIKVIRNVLVEMGFNDGVITKQRLKKLVNRLCQDKVISNISFRNITDERKRYLPAGVSVLLACFEQLEIKELHFSSAALREGILYEMEERFKTGDVRQRTAKAFLQRYCIDIEQAHRVRDQALAIFQQTKLNDDINEELCDVLLWAAMLHEVGLSVNYSSFHKHSQYLLQHSYMPGFNHEQQRLLATLVRFQRKTIKQEELAKFHLFRESLVIELIRVLRLSVIMSAQRITQNLPIEFKRISDDHWRLSNTTPQKLAHDSLLFADLKTEQRYWKSVHWRLELK